MAKMNEVQEWYSLELSNKVNAGNGLRSESLVGAREMGNAGNGRTMNPDLYEIRLSNSHKRDSMPVVSTNLAYT
jgi:hypothetical protein